MGPKKDRKVVEKGTKRKPYAKAKKSGKETKAKRSEKETKAKINEKETKAKRKQKTVAKTKSQPYNAKKKQSQTGFKGEKPNAARSQKAKSIKIHQGSIQPNKGGRKRKQKKQLAPKRNVKKPKMVKKKPYQPKKKTPQRKKQKQKSCYILKNLMWEAYDNIPEIEKQVFEYEKNIPYNEICSNFLNDQDDSAEMTFVEKIYQIENELCLKNDKYRNNNDWLKVLYEACQQEINQTKEILNKIYELKKYMPILNRDNKKQNPSFDQELYAFGANPEIWIGGRNETAPPGCGSVPRKVSKNSVIGVGQYVAAFVILDQKICDFPDNWEKQMKTNGYIMTHATINDGSWILARCICPPEKKRKEYIVADIEDVDEEDDDSIPNFKFLGKALPYFKVPRKALIPLPICIADPELNPETIFPVGADVLALYKETTSFFPAVVEEPPKTITDPYKLRFRDEYQKIQNQVYLVLQKYVLEYRDFDDIFTEIELQQLLYMEKIEERYDEIPL